MTDDRTPDDLGDAEPVTFEPVALDAGGAGPSRAHRAGRAVAWVAVGAVGATVLTGVAFAASRTTSSTPSPSPSAGARGYGGPDDMGGKGGMHGPMGGMRGGPLGGVAGAGPNSVLHGDLVVKTKSGATKHMLVQTGAITVAGTSSITVKSTDGFVATWSLGSSTVIRKFSAKTKKATASDLAVGDTVLVAGTRTTDTSGTAAFVRVRPTGAQLKKLLKNAPLHRWMHQRGGAPAPTATGSASGESTAVEPAPDLDPDALSSLLT